MDGYPEDHNEEVVLARETSPSIIPTRPWKRSIGKVAKKWELSEFAPKSGSKELKLRHWNMAEEGEQSPVDAMRVNFDCFDVQSEALIYTDEEYEKYLVDKGERGWTKEKSDILQSIIKHVGIRFVVVADRMQSELQRLEEEGKMALKDTINSKNVSIEVIKERFFEIQHALATHREIEDPFHHVNFRKEEEQLRKIVNNNWYSRSRYLSVEEDFRIRNAHQLEAHFARTYEKLLDEQRKLSTSTREKKSGLARGPSIRYGLLSNEKIKSKITPVMEMLGISEKFAKVCEEEYGSLVDEVYQMLRLKSFCVKVEYEHEVLKSWRSICLGRLRDLKKLDKDDLAILKYEGIDEGGGPAPKKRKYDDD